MFSSRTFMVSQLIFKSFIHLAFIFVYGGTWWSSFNSLHVDVQISQNHLLKRLFLLDFMLLPPLLNINWPKRLGFISGISVLFLWSMCLLTPVPGCFDYSGLVIQFDIRYWDPSCFVLLSQIAAAIEGRLWFHINFWNVRSISVKYVKGTLIGIALNL